LQGKQDLADAKASIVVWSQFDSIQFCSILLSMKIEFNKV
jgi:hypothetical protein